MHMSPAKHSYAWLPRKYDYRTDRHTDGRTDRRRTKWSLCAAMLRRRHKNVYLLSMLQCLKMIRETIISRLGSYSQYKVRWKDKQKSKAFNAWQSLHIPMPHWLTQMITHRRLVKRKTWNRPLGGKISTRCTEGEISSATSKKVNVWKQNNFKQ